MTEVALSTAVHLAQGRQGGPVVPQSEVTSVPGEDSVPQHNLSEGPLKRVVVTNTARSAPKCTSAPSRSRGSRLAIVLTTPQAL
ncbi:hypothetical protein [Streptomyces sp. NBC_00286]|uniref:hypothetical protein n=1 Tax=Streptomyces sp. NBC_00286 TaxID=2975701 RepID=UPI002E2B9084|nr:hypothetical protein [Streptomyces sp. NBC_00286]